MLVLRTCEYDGAFGEKNEISALQSYYIAFALSLKKVLIS